MGKYKFAPCFNCSEPCHYRGFCDYEKAVKALGDDVEAAWDELDIHVQVQLFGLALEYFTQGRAEAEA